MSSEGPARAVNGVSASTAKTSNERIRLIAHLLDMAIFRNGNKRCAERVPSRPKTKSERPAAGVARFRYARSAKEGGVVLNSQCRIDLGNAATLSRFRCPATCRVCHPACRGRYQA